jgi:SAM-dependent methyltransferase
MAERNFKMFASLLIEQTSSPRVLVVGGSTLGEGLSNLLAYPAIELVETDVTFGPRTSLICDAHDIPFMPESFDGVIIQAVLEHVLDPYRCVEEIYRVLKPQGLVYSETPFMQQVHEGRYDFARFTHLGHRRLFRMFSEIESGAVSGSGSALAWSYSYFLRSFTTSKFTKNFLEVFARLTSFYLKYFDYFLLDKPGILDAATGYYFFGRKNETPLPDRDLIKQFRGLL